MSHEFVAADRAKFNTLLGGGWLETIAAAALQYAPSLTNFEGVRCGVYPNGTPGLVTGLSDAGMTGGFLTFANNGPLLLSATLIMNPMAIPWMIAMRGALPIPAVSFAVSTQA